MSKYYFIFCCAQVFIAFTLQAQNDSTNSSPTSISGQFIIEKEKEIVLPQAQKRFFPANSVTRKPDSLQLDFINFAPKLNWPTFKRFTPNISFRPQYPRPTFQNYARIGVGNFASPLAELFYQRKLKDVATKTLLFYERFGTGAVNEEESRSNQFLLDFQASSRIMQNIKLDADLKFDHSGFDFFGNTNRDQEGFPLLANNSGRIQSLEIGSRAGFSSNSVFYHLEPRLNVVRQQFDQDRLNAETGFSLDGGFELKVDSSLQVGVKSTYQIAAYDGGTDYSRSLFQLIPNARYAFRNFKFETQLAIVNESNSSFRESNGSGVYPTLRIDYRKNPARTTTLKIGSGIDWNSLGQQLSENQFFDDSLLLQNTISNFRIQAKYLVQDFENLDLQFSAGYLIQEGLPLFIPSFSDSSKFAIAYDSGSIDTYEIGVRLNYRRNSDQLIFADLTYRIFETETIDRAWHLPRFDLKAGWYQRVASKLTLRLDAIVLAGIAAPVATGFGREELDPVFDLAFGMDYQLSERFSSFFNLNNLFNQNYERHIGYPVRDLSFKIGAQYRF
ncbi:MAG: hypothetical protein AAF789_06645 [Bacteroidota bacterium]